MKNIPIDIPRLFRNYNILTLLILSVGFGSLVIIVDHQAHKKDLARYRNYIIAEKQLFIKHFVDNAISYINYNNSIVEERLDLKLYQEVHNAFQLANNIYSTFHKTKSEQEIKILIKEALRPLRYFDGRGYIYIINMDGYTQLHPINPEKEGELLTNIKDVTGRYSIKEEIKLMRKKKEGYINYLWTKPNCDDGVCHMKRTFLKRFEPYDWFIGLGEYQENFTDDVKQKTLKWFQQSYDPNKYHFFINDYEGNALIINSGKYKKGANIENITDENGLEIYKEELKIAQNTNGDYLRYSWPDKTTGESTPKIAYIKGVDQWEWMVGVSSSTITIDKTIALKEKEFQRNSRHRLTALLLTILGASIFFFFISQYINKRIRTNFNKFISEFETAISKQQLLKEDKFNLKELRRLSSSINQLLKNHLKSLNDLKLSEQKFRVVVENAPVFICGYSPDGLIKLWNKKCEESFNYSADDILNKPFPLEEIYQSDSIATVKEFMNTTSTEYKLAHVRLINGKESYKYWASFKLNKNLIIWVGHDVTALKLAEKRYKDSRNFLDSLIQSIPNPIYYKDKDGVYLGCNSICAQYLGINETDIIGKKNHDIFPSTDADNYDISDQEVIENGIVHKQDESFSLPNGEQRELTIFKAPFYDSDKKVKGIIGVALDLTDRVKFEIQLQKKESEMRALNATKDKFFSIIAHDLRNPFNALITLSSYLIEAIESSNKTEAIELAKIIETSSEQGFELLVNLLEWSRTQTGAIQYKPELINLQKELKNPIQIVEGIAESKDIRIKHHIDEFTRVFADPNMIRTIVRNLLSNAVKFTPRGGQISFEAFNHDDEVLFKISDNGVGMSQDIVDKLFKIEVSTSSTGTEGEMGTGLGLILCSEFVKKHKGKLWVNSKVGEGSCFSFSLPQQPIHS